MSKVIGKPELIVINSVWEELEDLAKQKRGLLLELLKSRCKLIEDPEGKIIQIKCWLSFPEKINGQF